MEYTVRELELIIENNALKRELEFIKSKDRGQRFTEMLSTPDLIDMSTEMAISNLYKVAQIDAEVNYGKRHVVGWAQIGPEYDERFVFSYFLAESQVLHARDRIRQLGHMHKLFIDKAVSYIQKEYGTPAYLIDELQQEPAGPAQGA